jgi:hypothetical protein
VKGRGGSRERGNEEPKTLAACQNDALRLFMRAGMEPGGARERRGKDFRMRTGLLTQHIKNKREERVPSGVVLSYPPPRAGSENKPATERGKAREDGRAH